MTTKNTCDLEELENVITEEIEDLLSGLADENDSTLKEIQPTSAAIEAAARCAAIALLNFERGYRVGG